MSALLLGCLLATHWGHDAVEALVDRWALTCDEAYACERRECDADCPTPCVACGVEPTPDGCDFATYGRDLTWTDSDGRPNYLHCDACGAAPRETCATTRTWVDSLGLTQSVPAGTCAANDGPCLTAACLDAYDQAAADHRECRETCSDQACAEGDAACWEAACVDAAELAATTRDQCLGGCFADAATVPADTWRACAEPCGEDLDRADTLAFAVWAEARLAACAEIATTSPAPCFPHPATLPGADFCASRADYLYGLLGMLDACDAMRRDYDARLAAGETAAAAKAAVNQCGDGSAPLALDVTVTCDAQGGSGTLAATASGGLGYPRLSGTARGASLRDGASWTISARDSAGALVTKTGVVSCPWRCPAADACDGRLTVDVTTTCNPMGTRHDLAIAVRGGSGDYQLCGDAASGPLASGERWSVVVTDRQTGACGVAQGQVSCAPVDPACPVVELDGVPIAGDHCEGTPLAAALRVVPGTGPYTLRWLAGGAPIPGQTTANLAWSAAADWTCGGREVPITAEITCGKTGQVGRVLAGRPRVFAAPSAPTTSVQGCTTTLSPACPGDTFSPTTYTAPAGALPSSRPVSVTPAEVCGTAAIPVGFAGCGDCAQDAGSLTTTTTELCSGSLASLDFTTTSTAKVVQLAVVDTRGKLVQALSSPPSLPVGALRAGSYRVFAVASEDGVEAAIGADISNLEILDDTCYSLSPPMLLTIESCACPNGCDDGDACTTDRCDEATRRCVYTPLSCDDGDACDGTERCHPTLGCQAGPDLVCDDRDACNGLESCDPARGCRPGSPLVCDDGASCNGVETCDPAAGCVTTGALSCDDGDPCNGVESCAGTSGCAAATPARCDDGDACNGAEVCVPGEGCRAGAPLDCDDGDPCTNDACEAGACKHTPLTCDDGDACNGTETCDPARGCRAGTPITCDDGDPCNGPESCEPATGSCQPAPTGFTCDDGDACNGAETCDPVAGCQSGPLTDCDDGDACTEDACDAATGQCVHEAVVCDDGDLCNGAETCKPTLGCVAGTALSCSDGDACNGVEGCVPDLGCRPASAPDCDDGNPCTTDSCDATAGCLHEADLAACPDARAISLGLRLGDALLPDDLGDGCFEGSVAVSPCDDLPFCKVTVTACYNGTTLTSVTLSGLADLEPLGELAVEGPWSANGWCLEPAAPIDAVVFDVPFHDVEASVCVRPAGASVDLLGGVIVADADVSFEGRFHPKNWTLEATLGDLPVGDATLREASLRIVDHGDDGLDERTLNGLLTVGRGASAPTFEAHGDYDPDGFELELALPEGDDWEPVAGLALDELSGTLAYDGDTAISVHLAADVDLQPLGRVTFEGDFAVSSDGQSITGCVEATRLVSTLLAGVPLSNVRPRLCLDDLNGLTRARLELVGSVTLSGRNYTFTGTMRPGGAWELRLVVKDLALGAFTLDTATLVLAHAPATGTTASLEATTELDPPGADRPVSLEIRGNWSELGDLLLTATMPAGKTWEPEGGLVVTSLTGRLERTAGRWELHLSTEADLHTVLAGVIATTGTLDWTPDGLDLCVGAKVPFSKTFPELGLQSVTLSACLKDGAWSYPVSGTLSLGGKLGTFSGIYFPGGSGFDWRLELEAPAFDLGLPLEGPEIVITDLPAVGGVDRREIRVEGEVVFGDGASALHLHLSGEWKPSGTLTFEAHLVDGAIWEPVPGLRFHDVDGVAKRESGVWSLALDVHTWVDLGPLGAAEVDGTLTAANDFTDLRGCLDGSLPDRSVAGFTFTGVDASLCFEALDANARGAWNTAVSTKLSGSVTVAGQTLPFGGRFTPGDDWRLVFTVEGLRLSPFRLDTATFTIDHRKATGLDAITVDGELTVLNTNRPLVLEIDGAWSHTGTLSLAASLPEGKTWSPVDGVTLDTLDGTFRRATGTWALTLAAEADLELGPFGTHTLRGDLGVDADHVTGCLGLDLDLATTLGDLPMTRVGVEACLGRAPSGGLALRYELDGAIDLGDGAVDFGGILEPDPPALPNLPACDWRVTLDLPEMTLAGFPVQAPTIVGCKLPGVERPDVRLEADFVVGEPPSELHLHASGAWTRTGDLHLDVAMKPNTTWEPTPGLVFHEVDGTFDREAGVWSFNLGVATNIALGPFGDVPVEGDLLVEDGGHTIEGCLSSPLGNRTVAGFSLTGVNAELCLEQTATGRVLVPRIEGSITIPGLGGPYPLDALYTPGADWRLDLSMSGLKVGAITFETATFGVQRRGGPPERFDLDLEARLRVAKPTLNGGASAPTLSRDLRLDVSGAYAHTGDLTLTVTQPPDEDWEPLPGFVLEDVDGTMKRRSGKWSFDVSAKSLVELAPLGEVAFAGSLTVADSGVISGCIAGTPKTFTSATWAGVPVSKLGMEACFSTASGELTLTWGVSAKITLDGIGYNVSGVFLPDSALPDHDWRIDLTLPTLALGPFSLSNGHLILDKRTGGPIAGRLTGRAQLHPGANNRPLNVDVDGAFVNGGDLSLALTQPLNERWQPAASLPNVFFSNSRGTLARTAGVWSVSLAVDSQITASPLGTFRPSGTLTWDSQTKEFEGCIRGTVTNYTLMSRPITTPKLGLCYDSGATGLVTTGLIEGSLSFAGQSFPMTATVALGTDWKVIVEVANLKLGTFTLTTATLTFDHVESRTPKDIVTISGELTSGPWSVDVSGTWQDTGALVLQASAVATGSAGSVQIGALASGTFSRDVAGTWKLDLRTTVEVDFGPFGKLTIDGSLAASQGNVTGKVCADYTVQATPTVVGIAFTNVVIRACYDHDVKAWSYGLQAMATINGQSRAVTGTFEPGDDWRFTINVTNLGLGNGFTLPSASLTWKHTKATGSTALTLDGKLVLFAAQGDPKALVLDVTGAWLEGSNMELTVTQPEGRSWQPSSGLAATTIRGTLKRGPAGPTAGFGAPGGSTATVWSLSIDTAFVAALGGDIGTHGISGRLDIPGGGGFSGCLQTESRDAFSMSVGGVSMTSVRLRVCLEKSGNGPVLATIGFGGAIALRGKTFTFDATWQNKAEGGYVIVAEVHGLVFGGFGFQDATLTFDREARITKITLDATLVLGALTLQVKGDYSTTGDMSLAVTMPIGTVWQILPGLTLTGATGTLKVTGQVWTITLSVGSKISLGPVSNITVSGNLELVKDGDDWKPEGCVRGSLDASQGPMFQRLGMSGVFTAEACFGDETRYGFRISQWKPLPNLTVPDVFLEYVPLEDGWKFEVEVGPRDLQLGPVTITQGIVRGTLDDDNKWSIGFEGGLTFTAGGQSYTLADLAGSYDSVTQKIELQGTWQGELTPLAGLGFDDVKLTNPTVKLAFTFGEGTGEVEFSAGFTFKVPGPVERPGDDGMQTLTGTLTGGTTIGGSAEWFFAGSLRAPSPGLKIRGFAKPFDVEFCVTVASSSTTRDVCGETDVDVPAGVTLMADVNLPPDLTFTSDQGKVRLSINLDPNGRIRVEAELGVSWYVIQPGSTFPEVEWMMVDSLALFAEIDGANVSIGFDGVVKFKPRGTNNTVITGVAQIAFVPATSELSLMLYLDGRWYSPFRLDKIAIENPGFAIKIVTGTTPIPLPTSLGLSGYLYYLKSGNWPTYVDTPDTCDEFVDCAATSPCKQHLACASNVLSMGGTVFYDTVPSKSGFCFLGACAVTPTFIVRLQLTNLTSTDLINFIKLPFTALTTNLPAVKNALPLPEKMGDLSLPTLPERLSFELRNFQLKASTHNKEVFGLPFTAGFRALLDATVAQKLVYFDGYLGPKGLSLDAKIDPFQVGPVSLLADPLAREAQIGGTGFIKVNHDPKLDFFATGGTIEGWLMKGAFTAGQSSTFAQKKASTGDGWEILVGDPVEVCEDGACEQRGRVTVKLKSGASTRTLRSIEGAVRPGQRTHLAVVHRRKAGSGLLPIATSDFEVRVDGVALTLEPVTAALLSLAPPSTTGPLELGRKLDRLDDVRLWKTERSADELKGQARLLFGAFVEDPNLVARYEFDFDTTGTRANNSRYYPADEASTTTLLHGTLVNTSTALDNSDQRIYARLSLRLDKIEDTGLFAAVGTEVDLPLIDDPLLVRGRVQLGGGAMFGELYVPDLEFLRIGQLGGFVLGGFGQNGYAGDFDDGLYARLSLRPQFGIEASAKLAWNGASPKTIGSAQITTANGGVSVTGNLNLTFDLGGRIGTTGLEGTFAFSSANRTMDLSGKMKVLGLSLASAGIHLTKSGITLEAEVDLPTVLGIDLGRLAVEFSLDWEEKKLCGAADYSSNDTGGCAVEVCLAASLSSIFTIRLDCAFQPCLTDAACADGKQCMLGFCHDLLEDDTSCLQAEWCEGGGCAGVPPRCYTPGSRTEGQDCIKLAGDHCAAPLVCAGLPGVCKFKNKHHGESCDYSEQCVDTGTTCYDPGNWTGPRCLYTDQPLGAECERNAECKSGFCKDPVASVGHCACDDSADCPDGAAHDYCKKHQCVDRKANGLGCDDNGECYSGACSATALKAGVCYQKRSVAMGGACVADDHCAAGTCKNDVCKCTDDNQCNPEGGNGYYCDNTEIFGGNIAAGSCKPRLADGASCNKDKECRGNHCNFGECWTAGTRKADEECLRDDHCESGICKGLVPAVSRGYCGCTSDGSASAPVKGGCNEAGRYCKSNSNTCEDYQDVGDSCTGDKRCKPGLGCGRAGAVDRCYQPSTAVLGQHCYDDGHCKSGSCTLRASAAQYQCSCTADSQCDNPDTQYCDTGVFNPGYSCAAKVGEGGACNPQVCASNLICGANTGQTKHCYDVGGNEWLGATCYGSNDCDSRLSCTYKLNGGWNCRCNDASDCGSGNYCDDGTCKPYVGWHGYCSGSSECSPSYPSCGGSFRYQCYRARSAGVGGSCVADAECIHDICSGGDCRCRKVSTTGQYNANCASGQYCSRPDKDRKCYTLKSNGSDCTRDYECSSGRCSNGGKCKS